MKKIAITLALILSYTTQAQGIDAGGGGYFIESVNAGDGSSRVLTDIGSGGGGSGRVTSGIELLKLERVSGTSNFELKDARPKINGFLNSNLRSDKIIKMMKLKIMTDFNNIEEITLKDGTILRADEILKGQN